MSQERLDRFKSSVADWRSPNTRMNTLKAFFINSTPTEWADLGVSENWVTRGVGIKPGIAEGWVDLGILEVYLRWTALVIDEVLQPCLEIVHLRCKHQEFADTDQLRRISIRLEGEVLFGSLAGINLYSKSAWDAGLMTYFGFQRLKAVDYKWVTGRWQWPWSKQKHWYRAGVVNAYS